MAALAFAFVLVAVAFSVAAVMLLLFQRQILPVQAFVQFLLGGVADRNDFYLEVQGLACKLGTPPTSKELFGMSNFN